MACPDSIAVHEGSERWWETCSYVGDTSPPPPSPASSLPCLPMAAAVCAASDPTHQCYHDPLVCTSAGTEAAIPDLAVDLSLAIGIDDGCGAGGFPACRWCGFAQYVSIPCPYDVVELVSPDETELATGGISMATMSSFEVSFSMDLGLTIDEFAAVEDELRQQMASLFNVSVANVEVKVKPAQGRKWTLALIVTLTLTVTQP